jgi:hypothetical protein
LNIFGLLDTPAYYYGEKMSNDRYVKTEHVSLGGRFKESIGGIAFGVLLFFISFPLLFWNEGRAVKTAQALEEGAGAVISVTSDTVDRANEGKLIHLSGMVSTDERLSDPLFGVTSNGIRLIRQVSTYQWEEQTETKTEKKLGGGEERVTTYTYQKVWSPGRIDSSRFERPGGHENPGASSFTGQTFAAQNVTLGAFRLNDSQASSIGQERSLPVDRSALDEADWSVGQQFRVNNGRFETGNASAPQIGDIRVSFTVYDPETVSIVASQRGNSFTPYRASSGYDVNLLRSGSYTAEQMFDQAESENTLLTWLMRGGGLFMMWLGLTMIARPLVVVADIIPFVGNLVGMGANLFAFIIALPCALGTVAVAWIFYRPLIGIILVAAAVGIFVWGYRAAFKKKAAAVSMAPPPLPTGM